MACEHWSEELEELLKQESLEESSVVSIIKKYRANLIDIMKENFTHKKRSTTPTVFNDIPEEFVDIEIIKDHQYIKSKGTQKRWNQKEIDYSELTGLAEVTTGSLCSKRFWKAISRTIEPNYKRRNKLPHMTECVDDLKKLNNISDQESLNTFKPKNLEIQDESPFNENSKGETIRKMSENIKWIGRYKAAGPSGVHNQILRLDPESVARYLFLLYKCLFKLELIPEILLRATITLIPKKNMKGNSYGDFRPISVTDFEFQILSKLAIKIEKKPLEENISILQSGFLSGRSTTDCLLMVNRVRKKAIENKE